jgi:hypothetical protein
MVYQRNIAVAWLFFGIVEVIAQMVTHWRNASQIIILVFIGFWIITHSLTKDWMIEAMVADADPMVEGPFDATVEAMVGAADVTVEGPFDPTVGSNEPEMPAQPSHLIDL